MSDLQKTTVPSPQVALLPLPEFRRRIGGISAATLYRWEREQRVKLVRVGGRTFGTEAEVARLAAGQAA